MNAKKSKLLRKSIKQIADAAPVVTFHQRTIANGIPMLHSVVNPIRYPSGSKRRVYRDIKHGRSSPSHLLVANAKQGADERKAA